MSLVVAIQGINPDERTPRGEPFSPGEAATSFFRASRDTPDSPTAFVLRRRAHNRAHYHAVDQFQIVVDGKGRLGRHDISPYFVHFSRAHTPYGPLSSETGWDLLTLRTRYDPGSQHPLDKLKQIPDRRPWQILKKVTFPASGVGISLQDVTEIKDDQGLFVGSLTMAPHTRTAAPDPSGGDGQFVVVVKGSLMYDKKEHEALTVVFVKPKENAFQIHAGAHGLQALILNFPQVGARAMDTKTSSTAAGFKKWQCTLCSFAYDEALGMPEEGIAPGTRWSDVPDTWTCPDCSTTKSDFQMVTE